MLYLKGKLYTRQPLKLSMLSKAQEKSGAKQVCLETPLTLIFQVGVYCFRAIRCAPDRQDAHLFLTNGDG